MPEPGPQEHPLSRPSWIKTVLLLALLAGLLAFFALDGPQWLSLARLQALQTTLQQAWAAHPLATVAAFMGLFIALFALALPVGSVMSLAGGAVFGFGVGVVAVSFASSIGVTLAFLGGRHLFADAVRVRWARPLAAIDAGIEREGSAYLFSLRLVPLFPPGLLSLLFGLTRMRTGRFYAFSQLGMLPGTLAYVNAGTQLATLQALQDVLSPRVLLSLLLLAALPWVLRRGLMAWQVRQARRVQRLTRDA